MDNSLSGIEPPSSARAELKKSIATTCGILPCPVHKPLAYAVAASNGRARVFLEFGTRRRCYLVGYGLSTAHFWTPQDPSVSGGKTARLTQLPVSRAGPRRLVPSRPSGSYPRQPGSKRQLPPLLRIASLPSTDCRYSSEGQVSDLFCLRPVAQNYVCP